LFADFFKSDLCNQLAGICEQKFGVGDEKCLLFPARKPAESCRTFIIERSKLAGSPAQARLCQYLVRYEDDQAQEIVTSGTSAELHIVFFKAETAKLAKEFWQHSGLGISSRFADHCLHILQTKVESPTRSHFKSLNRHYGGKGLPVSATGSRFPPTTAEKEDFSKDHMTYLEERYGRNLPIHAAASAKRALRRRISGVLIRDTTEETDGAPTAGSNTSAVGPSSRGVPEVAEHDVYLYQCGMAAIWNAHQLCLATRPSAKSICFGYVVVSSRAVWSCLIPLLQVSVHRHTENSSKMGSWMSFLRPRLGLRYRRFGHSTRTRTTSRQRASRAGTLHRVSLQSASAIERFEAAPWSGRQIWLPYRHR
jgi:cystathionine gamma-synthase